MFKQVQEAIAGISNAAQATSPTDEAKGHTGIGELAAALNEFDVSIQVMYTEGYMLSLKKMYWGWRAIKIVYNDLPLLEPFDSRINYIMYFFY